MPDTFESESSQEAVRGMSDAAGKVDAFGAPAPNLEASGPAVLRACEDMLTVSSHQFEAIMRSYEDALRFGIDSYAVWTNARTMWAESCQQLSQATFDTAQQATKMLAENSAQMLGMLISAGSRTVEPITGRSGKA
jgi:hypothetical protein